MELVTVGHNDEYLPEALTQAVERAWKEKHSFSVPILVYQHDKPCSAKSPWSPTAALSPGLSLELGTRRRVRNRSRGQACQLFGGTW